MAKFDLRQYARAGAEARVRELQDELAAIFREFPDLRVTGSRARTTGRGAQRSSSRMAGSTATEATGKRRGRRRMSAEERRAVAERMRRYWEQRRAAQGARKK